MDNFVYLRLVYKYQILEAKRGILSVFNSSSSHVWQQLINIILETVAVMCKP